MDIIPDNSGFVSNKAADTKLRSKVFFVRLNLSSMSRPKITEVKV